MIPPLRLPRPMVLWTIGLSAIAGAIALLAWHSAARISSNPDVALLADEGGANWILDDEPFKIARRRLRTLSASFRKTFEIREGLPEACLTVRAFREAEVFLDGKPVPGSPGRTSSWKEMRRFDLRGKLAPGPHEILIQASNENAPPAVLALSPELGLRTGKDWEARGDGLSWSAPILAREPRHPPIAREFPSAGEALLSTSPLLFGIFLATALLTLRWPRIRERLGMIEGLPQEPGQVRWIFLFAWVLLAANDIVKVPEGVGFDAAQHLSYIRHLWEERRIPLPQEGWQMFQSPLYYIISAPLYGLLSAFFESWTVAKLLRVIPLACGILQVEVCYRALRIVFPDRRGLQILGTFLGGFLPMNLYLSQGLGNESLAAVLSGAAIVTALSFLRAGSPEGDRRRFLLLGLLLGLAILTKVTALLLLPPVLLFLAWVLLEKGLGLRRIASGMAAVLGVALLVSGWYYLRNWIAIGRPFLGGWDPARGILWWQDPGYRTPEEILRFGEALARPVYAATAGFWDSLHSTFWADGYLSGMIRFDSRPPWNYGLMISGAVLALAPAALILAGAFSGILGSSRPLRRVALFASASIALFLAALLHLYLRLPVYSTGKATYLAGLTPLFAILGTLGFERISRILALRAAALALLASWGVAAYLAYFVV